MKKLFYLNFKTKIAAFCISFILSIFIVFRMFSNLMHSPETELYVALFILLAICINLGLDILKDIVVFAQNRWVFHTFQWTLTIIAPILLILLLEHPLQKILMQNVSGKMGATIRDINLYQKNNKILPNKIDKNMYKINNLIYLHNDKNYILGTVIFSNDKHGETFYFSSKDKKWYRFHNDQYNYYKNKKIVPPNIKSYLEFVKNNK